MRNVDPTLPRDGTDLIATASRDEVDPTLPRYGTDLIATASRDEVDPTLPRYGTDLIAYESRCATWTRRYRVTVPTSLPLRVVMRNVRPDATALRY